MNSVDRLRIGVLFGGRSGEHAVSLMSARSVLQALDTSKYDVFQIGITQQGDWLFGEETLDYFTSGRSDQLTSVTMLPDPTRFGLQRLTSAARGECLDLIASLDVLFPVLHGTFGEDGTLQGLFELVGVAYVGAGVLGSSLGMDKGVFKDVMRANGIPVLEAVVISRLEIKNELEAALDRAENLAPYPLFTKPANLGSSVGVSKVRSRADLMEGLYEAVQYDRRVVVERGIQAREIEVSVLGNEDPEASIPGEIRPAGDFYTYEAKYHDDRSELMIPAPIPDDVAHLVRSYAKEAYQAIDCAGMARVDFLLEEETGELYLNELNTIPGFTEISMYPKLWAASSLPYPALLDRLIELALERQRERSETIWTFEKG
jgi:D-alanine-D-alanine ligase